MEREPIQHQIYQQGNYFTHRFLIATDEVCLSEAKLVSNSDYPNFCHLERLETMADFRLRGFGGEILRQVNLFLEQNGLVGILENGMNRDNPSYGIYKKNGWQESKKYTNWMFYNKPDEMNAGEVQKMIELLLQEKIADDFDFPEVRVQ